MGVVAALKTASITFHDFLHYFRAGHGTGTNTLKAKMLQQLATLREEVLYVIFLDLHKSYDALERSRCREILEGYGVGPRDRWLLQTYWRRLIIVAMAGGYYGTAFHMRGTVPIRFVTYNIFNGHNELLELALRGMSQANMDLDISKASYAL